MRVLLKRSIHMGALNEFISAAEYIAAFGNPNVILCPRGTSADAGRLPEPPRREHHAAVEGKNLGRGGGGSIALGRQSDLRAGLRARGGGVWRRRTLHRVARQSLARDRRRSEAGADAGRAARDHPAGEAAVGDSTGTERSAGGLDQNDVRGHLWPHEEIEASFRPARGVAARRRARWRNHRRCADGRRFRCARRRISSRRCCSARRPARRS
jgi:hypothetical protein